VALPRHRSLKPRPLAARRWKALPVPRCAACPSSSRLGGMSKLLPVLRLGGMPKLLPVLREGAGMFHASAVIAAGSACGWCCLRGGSSCERTRSTVESWSMPTRPRTGVRACHPFGFALGWNPLWGHHLPLVPLGSVLQTTPSGRGSSLTSGHRSWCGHSSPVIGHSPYRSASHSAFHRYVVPSR